jgi:hypothetical protein
MTFEDILKNEINKCKTIDDKIIKLVEIFANQTNLINIILDNLSPQLQKKILLKAGFKELISN